MEEKFKESLKQAAAFQKMWMNSMSGMGKVWSEYSPQNPPTEEIKKMRNGVLRAVSQTWEEYMRTPEFMEMMRETLNNSVQWQKMTKDSTNKVHQAMGSASKDDIQGVLASVQHVERRLLDHLDAMQSRLEAMQSNLDGAQSDAAKSVTKYQREVMKRLAEIEKAMKAAPVKRPSAAKPAPAKKVSAAKKATAPKKKTVTKKAAAKPKPRKAKG